jgi:ADP-ribose pyrophosphatase YjhB (NUDIX family)
MMNFYEYLRESVNENHNLSGVVLIYNNKILLVRPKKFKKRMKKWSIPKGHVEPGVSEIDTALRELKEESRIKLTREQLKDANKVVINYVKSKVNKKLTCYAVNIGKDDINVKLFNNMILGNFLKDETVEAGFFSMKDAVKIIEKYQLELLKFLE